MSIASHKKARSLPIGGFMSLATLAVAACLIQPSPACAQAAGTTAATIAIANPAKIAAELNETKDLQARWDVDTKGLQQQQSDKDTHLKTTLQRLQYLRQGTKEYQDQEQAYLTESIAYDSWVKEEQLMLMRRQKAQLKDLFNEIEEATKQVATARGITLVIAEQKPEIPENLETVRDADTLRAMISQRTVLYADPKCDLSSDIISALNKSYSDKAKH